MGGLLNAAADLLLGSECPGCGRPGWSLCESCRDELAGSEPRPVTRAGCDVPLLAANDYRPMLERVIPRFKDDGAWHLAGPLAARLAEAVRVLDPGPEVLLVPVPSLPAKIRRRGLDHAARLVAGAGRSLTAKWARLLLREHHGANQRGLGRRQRLANMSGAMGLTMRMRPARGTPVVVCDDVITTGASISGAVSVLRSAGLEVVGAAVVADADRKSGHVLAKWR